jgi:hypothetical protein
VPTWFSVLDAIADAVNPLLALTAIVVIALELRAARWRGMPASALPTALGVSSIYVVWYADRQLRLWQTHRADYSTHAAFATTLTLSLLILRPAWRTPLLAVWAGYLALIVVLRYHTLADVAIAALVAVIVTLPWHLAVRRLHISGNAPSARDIQPRRGGR